MSGSWATALKRAGRAIHFPNFPLRLVAPKADEAEKGLDVVTFITVPKTTKVEIRQFLETVYNVGVERVNTLNYEGKKKRSRQGFYRRPDYKKVYVTLSERWFPPKGFAVGAVKKENADEKA